MSTILFNPEIPEVGLRFETLPQVIANLQNSAPPWVIVQQIDVPPPADVPGFSVTPGEPIFDPVALTYTNTWVVTELKPDYAGLHAELAGSDLMDVVLRRSTPALTLAPAGSRGTNAAQLTELYTALDRVNAVYAVERTSRELMVIIEKLEARYANGQTDTPALITRMQERLTAWVTAVNFNAEDRDQLRAYLLQYVPTRGFIVP